MTTRNSRRPRLTQALILGALACVVLHATSIPAAKAQSLGAEAEEALPKALGGTTPGSLESRLGTAPGTDVGPFGVQPGRDEPLMGAGGGTGVPRE